MKYVLMFATDPAAQADVDPQVAQEVYGRIYEWFGANAAVITDSGAELLGPETATTVRSGGVVVDGPFSEAKEVIGGFSVIDVPDLDAAIALAKTGADQLQTDAPRLQGPDRHRPTAGGEGGLNLKMVDAELDGLAKNGTTPGQLLRDWFNFTLAAGRHHR